MIDIEYEVGDKVFLKVSSWRKILRFSKKGKLSLRFIGPYEILERVDLGLSFGTPSRIDQTA